MGAVDHVSETRRPRLNPIEAHRGDEWTYYDGPIKDRTTKMEGIMDPVTCDRVYNLCATWTTQQLSIIIGRAKLKENVDRAMGHDSIGSA